jgi:UDP:flavonoid glycosyltransferase YjiC (YdhE family)
VKVTEVLPAVFPAGSPVTCLVGAQSLTRTERIGAVEFRSYVPAGDILPAADWTICHGGQNTIVQSLLHNVPLLLFPGPIFERRYNAAKTQAAAAGRSCELSDFTPSRLLALLDQRDCYTAGATALGDALRASKDPTAPSTSLRSSPLPHPQLHDPSGSRCRLGCMQTVPLPVLAAALSCLLLAARTRSGHPASGESG